MDRSVFYEKKGGLETRPYEIVIRRFGGRLLGGVDEFVGDGLVTESRVLVYMGADTS